jgi:hypothetical protein
MHAQHFLPAALVVHVGLAGCVNAEVRPRPAGQVFDRRAFGDAHPQVVIHCKIERWVERTNFLPIFCAEEHRLLRDVDVAAAQPMVIGLARREFADHASLLINEITVGIDHRHIGIFHQKLNRFAHRFGIVGIIGVDPCQDVAFGAIETLIDRIGLTFILLADPGMDRMKFSSGLVYFLMISTLPSVEPPSMTMYSMCG